MFRIRGKKVSTIRLFRFVWRLNFRTATCHQEKKFVKVLICENGRQHFCAIEAISMHNWARAHIGLSMWLCVWKHEHDLVPLAPNNKCSCWSEIYLCTYDIHKPYPHNVSQRVCVHCAMFGAVLCAVKLNKQLWLQIQIGNHNFFSGRDSAWQYFG